MLCKHLKNKGLEEKAESRSEICHGPDSGAATVSAPSEKPWLNRKKAPDAEQLSTKND